MSGYKTEKLTNNGATTPISYLHWKPGGTDFWHALIIKLSVTGTFKLMPSTLALMAVQRHKAASKLAKPESRAQHLLEGGSPTTMLTSPRRSAQTPSFNVSLGQVAGGGGATLGLQILQALENVEKKRREKTKMTAESLEAMALLS